MAVTIVHGGGTGIVCQATSRTMQTNPLKVETPNLGVLDVQSSLYVLPALLSNLAAAQCHYCLAQYHITCLPSQLQIDYSAKLHEGLDWHCGKCSIDE